MFASQGQYGSGTRNSEGSKDSVSSWLLDHKDFLQLCCIHSGVLHEILRSTLYMLSEPFKSIIWDKTGTNLGTNISVRNVDWVLSIQGFQQLLLFL